MAIDIEAMKATMQRELNSLRQTGQELRVQVKLARADLRDDCDRLEKKLHGIQEEIDRFGAHAKGPALEIEKAARRLLDEVKSGYERLRRLQLD